MKEDNIWITLPGTVKGPISNINYFIFTKIKKGSEGSKTSNKQFIFKKIKLHKIFEEYYPKKQRYSKLLEKTQRNRV